MQACKTLVMSDLRSLAEGLTRNDIGECAGVAVL